MSPGPSGTSHEGARNVASRSSRTGGAEVAAQRRVPVLDGLRGLCAVAVLIYHVAYTAGVSNHFADPRADFWGYLTEGMGVFLPPFFVLSGLMLYRPFARRTVTGSGPRTKVVPFIGRRAVRIVPAFWVLVLASILLLDYDKIDGVWFFLRPLLMIHFFVRTEWITGIEPTWTVPTEMLFYVALPALAWLMHKFAHRAATAAQRARRLFVPLVVLVLIGMAWTAYCFLPSTAADVWYLSFFPFGYIGYFAGGMALAVLLSYAEVSPKKPALLRWAAKWPMGFWLVALLAYLANVPHPFGEPGMGNWGALTQQMVLHALFFVFSMCVVIPLVTPGANSKSMNLLLANKPMVFLGKISYGIYLWHVFFIHVVLNNGSMFGKPAVNSGLLRGTVGFGTMLTLVLLGTLVTALASHYVLEEPLNKKLRGYFDRKSRENGDGGTPADPKTGGAAPASAADQPVLTSA
ncbi:acyltransferase family protein [Streptomyces antarcticus]|uniref:acyltransferase family protein n=1 Tax=Streptomyces antarcticus TaxID=2996458 RepID=UPI00226E2A25|nr:MULTISPECIES: acyltransferase [unclassified Streptomyces]MCY0942919.1 acyltransferase [Streptomyces sp. H34-AA3]MCY0953034.1 acyltransferase [Streptomyces sp. H27-S2]MCZ4083121.1 acyltransferase [Streptomyces sp. H34-S5]